LNLIGLCLQKNKRGDLTEVPPANLHFLHFNSRRPGMATIDAESGANEAGEMMESPG
jgi:hypothetical protein